VSRTISPELVLVDPQLARSERARLLALDYIETAAPVIERPLADHASAAHVRALEAQVAALRIEVRALEGEVHTLEEQVPATLEQPTSGRLRTRVASVALPLSLVANAILIAVALAQAHVGEPSPPQSTAIDTTRQELLRRAPEIPATKPSKPQSHRRRKPAATQRHAAVGLPSVGAVERKVLALVVQSPAGKLPARLIDSRTGLAKNGLQAICRRGAGRSFVCVVRPTKRKPAEGLYVRYRIRPSGRGAFTWSSYRTG
jgi:hypothetical protein